MWTTLCHIDHHLMNFSCCRLRRAPPAAHEVMKVKKLIVWSSPLLANAPTLPPRAPASLHTLPINIHIGGLLPGFHPLRVLRGKMTVFHGSLCSFGTDCSLRPLWSSASRPRSSCLWNSLRRQHYPSYGTGNIPQFVQCFFSSVCLPLDTIFVHLIKHINLAPRPSLYRCEYLGRLASLLGCCPFSVSSAWFEMCSFIAESQKHHKHVAPR